MARLIIANCTKQRHEFHFRVPEHKDVKVKVIGIGAQEQIWNDSPLADLEEIIKQHERFGLIEVSRIDRHKDFAGLCYSIDRPIDVEKIMIAIDQNDQVLEDRALEDRKHAAQAVTERLALVAQEQGNGLSTMEVEISEIIKPGQDKEGFKETITAGRDAGKESRGRGRGRRN